MVSNVLDNLFEKKDTTITDEVQENVGQETAENITEDITNQSVEENATTEVTESNPSEDTVVEPVLEVENATVDENVSIELVDGVEYTTTESVSPSGEFKKQVTEITDIDSTALILKELRNIVNSSQGLDYELVEVRRKLNDIIKKYSK